MGRGRRRRRKSDNGSKLDNVTKRSIRRWRHLSEPLPPLLRPDGAARSRAAYLCDRVSAD